MMLLTVMAIPFLTNETSQKGKTSCMATGLNSISL